MKFSIRKLLMLSAALCQTPVWGQSVGSTDGVFNVSDMGSANYSIPIKIPDGIGDLKPELAFNYSSQGGDGPMGVGWSISGLSAITRSGNTIYHDKKVQGVRFTTDDKYSLDGSRLIVTSGIYGAAGSKYHTEIESFREITAGVAGTAGPASFTAEDMSGNKYEYGGTGYTVTATGSSAPYKWLLKSITDLQGNSITISYSIVNGNAYPLAIAYNQNATTGFTAKSFVRFTYSTITTPAFTYSGGGKIFASRRLDKVSVNQVVSGVEKVFRSYTLSYTSDFYTHLYQVTEKGAQELESLKPTEFTYGTATETKYTGISDLQTTDTKVQFAAGDFNGDGKKDLIQYSSQALNNSFKLYLKSNAPIDAYQTVGPLFTLSQSGTLQSDPSINPNYNTLTNQTNITGFDFNGDGYDDFMYMQMQNYKNCKCAATKQAFFVYTSNGTSLTPLDRKIVSSVTGSNDGFGNLQPLTGDFDGDGKSEILLVSGSDFINNTLYNYFSYLIGQEYLTPATSSSTSSTPNAPVYLAKNLSLPFASNNDPRGTSANDPYSKPRVIVIDYDGDGKNELLVLRKDQYNNNTSKVYALNVTYDANNKPVIGNPSFVEVSNIGYPTVWHNVLTGDFNGDGVTDLLTSYQNTSNATVWETGYGKGDGTFEGVIGPNLVSSQYYPGFNDTIRPIIIADFNGDGKDDIFDYMYYNNPYGTFPPKLFLSKGNHVFNDENVYTTAIGGGTFIPYWNFLGKYIHDFIAADFNGDGSVDIFSRNPDISPISPSLTAIHPDENKQLISQIKNGLGAISKFQYKTLADPTVASSGYAPYPIISRRLPIKVVSRSIEDNGVNTTGNSTSYFYSSPKFHAQGKGMLGFDRVTSFEESTALRQEKNYTVNTTYAFPYLSSVLNSYSPNPQTNIPVSSTTYSYGIFDYGARRIFPYVTTTTESSALTGQTTSVTNNYVFPSGGLIPLGVTMSQHIGKPFSITTNKGGGLDISTETFTYPNYSTFTTSGTVYYAGHYYSKPNSITVTSTRINQPSYTRKTNYNYSTTLGWLLNSVADPASTQPVTTSYWYDAYGNPVRKLTSAPGVLSKDQRMSYDPSNRYLASSYDVSYINIKNTATYDPLIGARLTATDPDGFTKTNTYDAFGRIKTQGDNNGSLTTKTYSWGDASPADNTPVSNASYYVGTSANTGEASYTNYDRLGRDLKTSNRNYMNGWVNTTKSYNILGQLWASTRPTSSMTMQTSYNEFDAYGRMTKIITPEGNTSFAFANSGGYYTVTKTNMNNKISKVKTDASGKKVEVTDELNNVMSYLYHSNGNEKTISAGGNVLQSYTYDDFGHLKERQDPNYGAGTGTYTYTYDAFGQTLTQKDPKSNTYTYSYDALGRMFQKVGPEGTYNFTFENNTGVNCNKSTQETGPEGEVRYTYGMGDQVASILYLDGDASINATGSISFPIHTIMTYDTYGRPFRKQFSTGAGIEYAYNQYNGKVLGISDYNSGKVLYYHYADNDYGQIIGYLQNNGIGTLTTQNYDAVHDLLTEQKTQIFGSGSALLRHNQYNFNPATGNLSSRKDVKYGLEESFVYDDLDRLTDITNPTGNITMAFSANGNIESKTDAGAFTYDQANRLSRIDNFVNIPTVTQEVTYTPFDKVSTIKEGNMRTEFRYWPGGDRAVMKTFVNGSSTPSYFKSYAGDMERSFDAVNNTDKKYTYIRNPEGKIIAIIANENGVDKDYIVLTDYQNSITQIIDGTGAIVEEKSYDAWGRLRNPTNWQPYAANLALGQPSQLLDRGYTGHEHLAAYGIINMDGRLYDPVMGRMFSPDMAIQATDNFQNYNRYSYCLNNPLKYSDPSGNFLTWNMGFQGFGFGINLTPIGIPVGIGFNFGNRMGFYAEVGYRVGGTGLGSGATVSQSIDYDISTKSFGTTSSANVYASLGVATAGASVSRRYDITKGQWDDGTWAVSLGLGYGNDESGSAFTLSYGTGGFSWGIGGYDNPSAWKANPKYDPGKWMEDYEINRRNNCYSYALDDYFKHVVGGLNPGDLSNYGLAGTDLKSVTESALSDGLKKPNLFNRLGFGKRGYYSVYLVVDNTGGATDYHWYRQDKGGLWSSKHGGGGVVNRTDAAGHLIANPARANHNYTNVTPFNYKDGGILLWRKR